MDRNTAIVVIAGLIVGAVSAAAFHVAVRYRDWLTETQADARQEHVETIIRTRKGF